MRYLFASLTVLFIGVGCSTTGTFKVPPDTTLKVTNRTATIAEDGTWQTSPFFWAETGGAKYQLMDKSGNVIRSGKLKTHFRPVSIFWPPAAIIYWPMGFQPGVFDLTRPADGTMVMDDSNSVAAPAAAAPTPAAPPAAKKKKGQ